MVLSAGQWDSLLPERAKQLVDGDLDALDTIHRVAAQREVSQVDAAPTEREEHAGLFR